MSVEMISGAEGYENVVAALASELGDGESAICAASTMNVSYRGFRSQAGVALLTDQRMLIAKPKTFGRARANVALDLRDIVGCSAGPLMGVGPTWVVEFQAGETGTMYFLEPSASEEFERQLRLAISATSRS